MPVLGGGEMTGWIIAFVIVAVAVAYYHHVRIENKEREQREAQMRQGTVAVRQPRLAQTTRAVPITERSETGPMIYYANDRHGGTDKEYRFNYKRVNGAYRAYILKMPDLRGRDGRIIPTHRLWDENNKPYICWNQTVTSLKDMQTISRVWADSIQEYIATGTRFGPE